MGSLSLSLSHTHTHTNMCYYYKILDRGICMHVQVALRIESLSMVAASNW